MTVKNNRRNNLRLLAQAIGGISELADFLGKSPSQISHLIGNYVSKNIGDKLASEVEKAFAKPSGWLDVNYTGHEIEVLATAVPPAACYRVPLLKRAEIINWVSNPNSRQLGNDNYEYLYTSAQVSPAAYACQVQVDSMETTGAGISFPQGSIVIADPALPMRDNAFVLVRLDGCIEPMLRQVARMKTRIYLSALNSRYPLIEYQESFLHCGVVKANLLVRSKW